MRPRPDGAPTPSDESEDTHAQHDSQHLLHLSDEVRPVTIAADGTAVTAVSFGEQNLPGDRQPTALTTEAANQIMAYLAGQRSAFTVPMRPEGSAFQQEVWKAAANIPYGHTTTARALAETLGRPGSFRSVGAALRACPTPLLVPTHRIVTATGKPTSDINAALSETGAAAARQVALPCTGATETL